jgi:single-stranded-DNA-specific exonuclease
MKTQRWILRSLPDESVAEKLGVELNNLPPALARALVLRGITTIDQARLYFRGNLSDLLDPFGIRDMDKAVSRLLDAINTGEEILVYGDYDVDGTTSTALLVGVLQSVGAVVRYFIPNRLVHGYGLSKEGIDAGRAEETRLICTLDCGITSVEEAAYIRSLGIDLIVCDHHTPKDDLPDAVAVVDPRRSDCAYPFKELCGCGLAFKLSVALFQRLGRDPSELEAQLDLVALATISDVVPVRGENRILLRAGFDQIRTSPRVGLQKLAEEARVRLGECDANSVLFSLGPRINAAGRLGDADRAVSLLLATDEIEAVARARQLERLNQERRRLDTETQSEAFAVAETILTGKDRHSLVVFGEKWHGGVVGIVASRLVDRFYRPAVVLSSVRGVIRGSVRSTNGINIFSALTACQDLLVEFGGHDYAAGLTIEEHNISEFAERFDRAVADLVTPETLDPVVEVDSELSFSDLDERFWAVLRQFAPFGPDNNAPVFITRNLIVADEPKTVGRDQNHLKFRVREEDRSSAPRDVIGFRMGEYAPMVRECRAAGIPLDLLFSVQENNWNGRKTLQLRAHDMRMKPAITN